MLPNIRNVVLLLLVAALSHVEVSNFLLLLSLLVPPIIGRRGCLRLATCYLLGGLCGWLIGQSFFRR